MDSFVWPGRPIESIDDDGRKGMKTDRDCKKGSIGQACGRFYLIQKGSVEQSDGATCKIAQGAHRLFLRRSGISQDGHL